MMVHVNANIKMTIQIIPGFAIVFHVQDLAAAAATNHSFDHDSITRDMTKSLPPCRDTTTALTEKRGLVH